MLYEKLEFTFNKTFKLRTYNLLMRLTYMDKSDRGKSLLKERCNIFVSKLYPAVSHQTDLLISCGVTATDMKRHNSQQLTD